MSLDRKFFRAVMDTSESKTRSVLDGFKSRILAFSGVVTLREFKFGRVGVLVGGQLELVGDCDGETFGDGDGETVGDAFFSISLFNNQRPCLQIKSIPFNWAVNPSFGHVLFGAGTFLGYPSASKSEFCEGDTEGVGEGVDFGEIDGFATGLEIGTPLPQTVFFPLLIQVKSSPDEI